MEQLLTSDLSVVTLLGIFIIGLFTKRFVPWWIHEEALNKLKEYEKDAPELIDEMKKALSILEDPSTLERLNVVAPRVKEIRVQSDSQKRAHVAQAGPISVRRKRMPARTPLRNGSREAN